MRSSPQRSSTFALGVFAALALVLSACGDDGADVRDLGGEASGSVSGSGSGSGSGAAAAEQACAPVGEELEADADTTVDVGLDEYAFDPSTLDVEAGVVTFAAANNGEEAHELAFIPGGGEIPLTEDGAPDEDALADVGAFELEAFGPGQTCNATYELTAGDYTVFCIVETAAGETHASLGMTGSLTVG